MRAERSPVDGVRRLGRRRVGARHGRGEGGQLVVQPDGEVERVLAGAALRLVERLLDLGQLLRERPRRVGDRLLGLRALRSLRRRLRLVAHRAQPGDGVVGGGEPVADLGQQGELLREVLVGRGEARVLPELEGPRESRSAGAEARLVASRNRAGPIRLAAPQDEPIELRGGRVAEIPGEGVEARLRGDRLGRVVARAFLRRLGLGLLRLLRREGAHEASLLVQDLELHLLAVLRRVLQQVVEARAVGRVLAHGAPALGAAEAVGDRGLEEVGGSTRDLRGELAQGRDVVEDPERAAVGRGDEVVVLHDAGR